MPAGRGAAPPRSRPGQSAVSFSSMKGLSIGARPSVLLHVAREIAGLVGEGTAAPNRRMLSKQSAVIARLGRPTRVLVTQRTEALAAGGAGRVARVVREHVVDALLDRERGRAPGILDLAEPRRQVVGGRITGGEDELVQRPCRRYAGTSPPWCISSSCTSGRARRSRPGSVRRRGRRARAAAPLSIQRSGSGVSKVNTALQ